MELDVILAADGAPELSVLGKRIELLRIDRGLSKQALARRAGTSRQQLWRVMTGKSELTGSLCLRLSDVLQADPRTLRDPAIVVQPLTFHEGQATPRPPATLEAWLGDPDHVLRSLATLPGGESARVLRLDLLDAAERRARLAGIAIPAHLAELRRRVVAGEL